MWVDDGGTLAGTGLTGRGVDRAAGDNELRELAVLLSLAVVDGAVEVGTVTAEKRRENIN